MTTFKVDDVEQGTLSTEHLGTSKTAISGLVGNGVEASSVSEGNYVSIKHNLIYAVNTAYDQHLPLVFSPDMIWLAISQGLSNHITNNAEQLRHQFVDFDGKKELIVLENAFRKGNPNNNWPHMFGEFSKQLAGYIGKKRDLIVSNFSTTGPVERAASEIVLMESMSKYFDYTCMTMCGIPEITLLGTTADWQDIQARARSIAEFDLSWWSDRLDPILQEFVNASQGKVNVKFWQNTYKKDNGSGGPHITGWMTDLFPYLIDHSTKKPTVRNEFRRYGLGTNSLPMGMAKVPFKWSYYDQTFKMELAAGFSGFRSDNGIVVPQIGWFVRDTELMADAFFRYDIPNGKDKYSVGWKERDNLHQKYLSLLKPLGFKSRDDFHYSYDQVIAGSLPRQNLEQAKQIVGLTLLDKDPEDQ